MSRLTFYSAALLSSLISAGPAEARGPNIHPRAESGLESVNQPVVSRTDYVLDLSNGYEGLGEGEAARLDAWFRSLELRYGDTVYVEAGPGGESSRAAVQAVVNRYGLFVAPLAPVSAGAVPEGSARVIVSRTEAYVPGCPNWSRRSDTDFGNRASSNFGCGVNSNLAAMIANPEDLLRGREPAPGGDSRTLTKTVDIYRRLVPTGTSGTVQGEAAGSK